MLVKIVSLALAVGLVLWLFFYLPKRLKAGRSARIRYVIFSVIVFIFAAALLKVFL
jgi:hypothetical protein